MSVAETPAETTRVLVCASTGDHAYLENDSLLGFLRGLEQDGIAFCVNAEGADIDACDVAVVLVSQDFLNSPWCADKAVSEHLRLRRDAGMIVVPIILSACEWERHEWIASRQFLPGGQETIEEHYREPGQRKRLYLRIRKELRAAVERARELRQKRSEPAAATVAASVAERKQVTALHCALGLTEKDGLPLEGDEAQEILHEIIPDFRSLAERVVTQYQGSVAQLTGNGMLVWFGHPVVHEDDARSAARAAMALVEAIRQLSVRFEEELAVRLHVRIGIHTSLAVVSSGADGLQGDAATVAARLEESSAEDQVLISDATLRLVHGFFETEAAGEIGLPGAMRRIKTFRIVGASGAESRFDAVAKQGLLPIVGRSQEVELILDRWRATKEERGQVVTICAEAGLGKSRLLHEVRDRLSAEPHHWIESRCSPYHQNTPFHPIVNTLAGPWLRLDEETDDHGKLKRLEKMLAGIPDVAVEEMVPTLAPLLSIPLEPPHAPLNLPPKQMRRVTIDALTLTMLAHSLQQPAVFVVEDVHWADPSTLELIETVIGQVPTVPLMVLLAFRPEFKPPALWMTGDNVSQITLSKLHPEEMERMILQITEGKTLPRELMTEITRKTDGFPLFIEDLTRMVIESDMVEARDEEYVLSGPLRSLAIPDTLQGTLMARMERLASARVIAQLGATIGREFFFELLSAVADIDDERLTVELNRLVAAGLLYKRGLLSRARYIFKHALVQEALRQSLLKRERKRYHRMIAAVIEERFPDVAGGQPEVVAYHYSEAGEPANAIVYWIRAAEMAVRRSANAEAHANIRSGLSLVDEMPQGPERNEQELRLLTLESAVLAALRGWGSAELQESFARAMELVHSDTSVPALQLRYALWKKLMVAGKLNDGLRAAAEMRDIARKPGLEHYMLEAEAAFTDFYGWLGEPVPAIEHGRRGLALYDLDRDHAEHTSRYGEDPGVIHVTYLSINLYLAGQIDESRRLCTEAEQWLPRLTHTFSRGFLLFTLAWNAVQRRDVAEADRLAQATLDFANEHQFAQWIAVGTAMKGWAIATRSPERLEEGAAMLEKGMKLFVATGAHVNGQFYPALLADLWLKAGDVAKGMAAVERGFRNVVDSDERYYHSEIHRCKAELSALAGEKDGDVEGLFNAALQVSDEQQAKTLSLRTMTGFARWLAGHGRIEEAARRLAAFYDTFNEGFDCDDLQCATRLLGELRGSGFRIPIVANTL
jgi:class 3 adenylate cyclase